LLIARVNPHQQRLCGRNRFFPLLQKKSKYVLTNLSIFIIVRGVIKVQEFSGLAGNPKNQYKTKPNL
jgi:hypothetical protein